MALLKYEMAVSTIITVLLMTSLVSPVVAAGTTFQNVTVDVAYEMITDGSFPDLVILDVRYQYEYDLNHLYDAILIPYDELETRIGELEEHKNNEIMVYCRSGYRSKIACEILVEHDFTKVYNMVGGILAWIDAGYPICGISVTTEELTGAGRNKAISEALDYSDVKKLRLELIEEGFTPEVDEATAVKIIVSNDGFVINEVIDVTVPFNTHGGADNASIIYADNGSVQNAWAIVTGPASMLEEPMDILKENETYQAMVENLIDQGYSVDEANAQVVTVYKLEPDGSVGHMAIINVGASKEDSVKPITALVCIDSGEVLSIYDDFWCGLFCTIACEAVCVIGAVFTWGGIYLPCSLGCAVICHIICG